jgi:hypothetical protein
LESEICKGQKEKVFEYQEPLLSKLVEAAGIEAASEIKKNKANKTL